MGFIPQTKITSFLLSLGLQIFIGLAFAILAYYGIAPFNHLEQLIYQLIDGIRKSYLPDLDQSIENHKLENHQFAIDRMNKLLYVMFNVIFLANFTNLLNFFPILMVPQLCLFIISIFFLLMVMLAFIHGGWRVILSFAPKNVPKIILPLLYLIELLSFCIKPFVFTVRLVLSYIVSHKFIDVIGQLVPQKLMTFREIIIFALKLIELSMSTLQVYLLMHLMYYSYSSLVTHLIPKPKK
jgi:hypothetical protein